MPSGIYQRTKHWKIKDTSKMGLYWRGKNKPLSEETKIKIGNANRGKKYSEEIRKNMSERMKGRKTSEETRKKMSLSHKGKMPKNIEEFQRKGAIANIGRKPTEETRRKMSEAKKGEKAYQWKGGKSSIDRILRRSLEYKLWREAVFSRDNFTCIWCGDNRGGNLEADHIKPFCNYPELRFAIDNGRTLCKDCHKKTETWGNNKNCETP